MTTCLYDDARNAALRLRIRTVAHYFCPSSTINLPAAAPTAKQVATVGAVEMRGITEASATLSPLTPHTHSLLSTTPSSAP
mmetsp:Transcript_12600/g.17304  ORF Transcript_12600/g.17304 Transcript_12600/m.17304 type:complete len:81 (-) Transcript_12600:37-279(-)